MDIFEIEKKETLGARRWPTAFARWPTCSPRNNDIEFEQGGMKINVHVPDEVHFKVELEVETDERELEIELKW